MAKAREQINFTIHYLVKPAANTFIRFVYAAVADIIKEKDEKGWNSLLIRRMRKAFSRFLNSSITLGDKELSNYRDWVKQLFDLICLRLEVEEPLTSKVEEPLTSKRWEQLVRIAKEEGLI